jgi:hypothetical protein
MYKPILVTASAVVMFGYWSKSQSSVVNRLFIGGLNGIIKVFIKVVSHRIKVPVQPPEAVTSVQRI